MTTLVQLATTDNAFFKPLEVPLPLTHAAILDVARKKFKTVTKQSRLFDGVSGEEIAAGAADVELAAGAKIMVSGKVGWKGADRLRAERQAEADAVRSAGPDASATTPSSPGARSPAAGSPAMRPELAPGLPLLRLQLVSFAYDEGQPHDTATNLNARALPNPGKAARGRTGLDKRLAREVLASHGAAELCERLVQEALQQVQLHFISAAGAADAAGAPTPGPSINWDFDLDAPDTAATAAAAATEAPAAAEAPAGTAAGSTAAAEAHTDAAAGGRASGGGLPLLRVGVGCDRGLHRSVALAEAATARLVRKAEHARSGRNSPGLEALLRRVRLVETDHRELARARDADGAAGGGVELEAASEGDDGEEDEEDWGKGELRLVPGA